MKNYLQKNIKTLAMLNNKPVSQVAQEVGVSPAFISDLKNTNFSKVDLFADYFAIEPKDLLFTDLSHKCLEYIYENYVQFDALDLGEDDEQDSCQE